MAEIELRIVATDADDLRETLARLLGEQPSLTNYMNEGVEQNFDEEERLQDRVQVQVADVGEPAATTRRRRRTSAEIAADNAASQGGQGAASSASGAGTATEAGSAGTATNTGQTTGAASKAPDPFGDQIKQVAAETKAEEAAAAAGPTSDDIQAAALAFSMAKSMVEAQKVLMSFTAENGDPVKTIKQVQPKDYAAVLAALQV